jgi:hypothetical protein
MPVLAATAVFVDLRISCGFERMMVAGVHLVCCQCVCLLARMHRHAACTALYITIRTVQNVESINRSFGKLLVFFRNERWTQAVPLAGPRLASQWLSNDSQRILGAVKNRSPLLFRAHRTRSTAQSNIPSWSSSKSSTSRQPSSIESTSNISQCR